MTRKLLAALTIGLALMVGGCRAEAIDKMARTTVLVDEQFSAAYRVAASDCLKASDNWEQYDECLAPWTATAEAVQVLRDVTLSLDVAEGRKGFKAAACHWFRAVAVVDSLSLVDLPAARAALDSKWNRQC